MYLLEELEKVLHETNHEKQRLNVVCETVWNMLNPPGTEKNGLFKIEKKDVTPKLVQVSEETSNMSSSLGESVENANKLIALGKLVRDTTKCDSKKNVNLVSDVGNRALPRKEKANTITKQIGCNIKVSSCDKFRGEVKPDNCHRPSKNIRTKIDFLSDKKGSNLEMNILSEPDSIKHIEDSSAAFTGRNKKVPEVSLNTECNSGFSTQYSHLCSLSLPYIVKTLKIPEDLQRVLKHYYNYEKHRETLTFLEPSLKPSAQTFRRRLHNVIKLKLNNDLKTNTKHTERYLKYLDIAEEITKSKTGKNSFGVEYSSVEDLQQYEEKVHRLTELKIRTRLFSIVCDKLSNLTV